MLIIEAKIDSLEKFLFVEGLMSDEETKGQLRSLYQRWSIVGKTVIVELTLVKDPKQIITTIRKIQLQ